MLEFVVSMINNTPQEIYDFLRTIKNPVQFIDSRVDADALCSAFALYHVLKKHFDIELTLCYEKTISDRYTQQFEGFLEVPPFQENIDPKTYDFSKHDCLICTDSGSIHHLSNMSDFEKPQGIKILNIDHHEGNQGYGDLNYVKILGAACSVVYELLKKWDIKPEVQVANALLIGITLRYRLL
jgi:nanoRNase/pAp phosphatase (c-di-AMP/oligoRNAs hydrolase)